MPSFRNITLTLSAAALSFGCVEFSEQYKTIEGHDAFVFDDRLPNAMEDVFEHCFEPLTLQHNALGLGPFACDPAFASGSLEATAANFLGGGTDFPRRLVLNFTPPGSSQWIGNCFVTFAPSYVPNVIRLSDLSASWGTVKGGAGLLTDFDFDPGWGATVSANATASCIDPFSAAAAQGFLTLINGAKQIPFSSPDLDIDFDLSHEDGFIYRPRAHVDVSIGTMQATISPLLPPAWRNAYQSAVYDEDVFESTLSGAFEFALNGPFSTGINNNILGQIIVDELDANPVFQRLCEISLHQGELVIVKDEDCEFDPLIVKPITRW